MKIDAFLIAIALAVAAAFAAPSFGMSNGPLHAGLLTELGVALVFFLHGAAISPAAMRAAAGNWRLHGIVQISTYLVFPLIGLLVWFGAPQWLSFEYRIGFFFLCAISSTISSSVAMTALARGNVAGAIFNATLSGLAGMVLTPLLMGLILTKTGSAIPLGEQAWGIAMRLLLPFVAGQVLRPLLVGTLERQKAWVGKADRAVIVMIVYVAFCDAAAAGTWTGKSISGLLGVVALDLGLLGLILWGTRRASRLLGLSKEDEITAVFCGSKKSLANGAPIGKVIFGASPMLSVILVPLLIYHQLQLVVCAMIARRYAARDNGQ